MLTLAGTFKSIFGWRTAASRGAARQSQSIEAVQRVGSALVAEADEEQLFLASMAGLSAKEREQRIARREWYRRLAERQALIEVEQEAERNWWK